MPSLVVDLDDQASDGLANLDSALMRMASTTDIVAKSTENLTSWQRQQITVINQAKSGWADLGIAATNSLSNIAVTGIRTWGGIAEQSVKTSGIVAKAMIDQTASVTKWMIGTKAAITGLDIIWGRHRDELDRVQSRYESMWGKFETAAMFAMGGVGAAMVDQVALHGALGRAGEQAAFRIGTAFLRIGPQVAGATLALKAHEAALARTGERIDILTAKPLASQTAEQAREWQRLTKYVEESGRTIQEVSKSWSVSANQMKELYGVEVTTGYRNNLDRVNEASKGLAKAISSDMSMASGAFETFREDFSKWWNTPFEFPQSFDEHFTRLTDNQVKNIEILTNKYKEARDAGYDFLDSFDKGPKGSREYQNMFYEREDDQAKLQAKQEKNKDSFEQLRIANDKIAAAAANRAEAERLASLKTTAAIDAELRKMSERDGRAADAANFDKEDGERRVAITEYLQKRRVEVIKQAEEQAIAVKRKALEEEQKQFAARFKLQDAEKKRAEELFALEEKRFQQRSAFARDLAGFTQDKAQGLDNEKAKSAFDQEKNLTAEKMKLGGSNDSQIKTKLFQMDMDFAKKSHDERMLSIGDEAKRRRDDLEAQKRAIDRMSGDAHARSVAEAKWRADLDKAEFDIRKKRIEELAAFRSDKMKLELAQSAQLEDAKLAKAKERLEKEKRAAEEFVGKFDQKSFMQQQDPDKVYRQMEADRVRKAKQDQAAKDEALAKRAEGGDENALRRFNSNQKDAAQRASRGLYRDVQNGNISENEATQAQAKVAQQAVQAMQQNGGLTQQMAGALTESLKSIANQQASIAGLTNQVQKLTAFAKGQQELSKKQQAQIQTSMGSQGPGYGF